MKRTFNLQITCSLEDSFELVSKSGNDILSWHKHSSNKENNYIEWKQSIWSLSGSAVIIAKLEQVKEKETSVIIDIIKPFQFIDPLNICEKVFNKLEQSLQRNITIFNEG